MYPLFSCKNKNLKEENLILLQTENIFFVALGLFFFSFLFSFIIIIIFSLFHLFFSLLSFSFPFPHSYKDSTKITLLNRHPDLWKSQIDTVLKETKYYYPSSSLSVSSLSPTGPWAFQQVAKYLFSRKKIDLPKGICCDFESDVEEEERRRREEEEERGEEAAREVEREIQEEDGQLVECECCFDDVPLSFAVVCSSGDHFLCYECIRRYVKENVGPLMVIGGEGEKKEEGGDDCVRFLPCMSMGGCEAVIRSKMIGNFFIFMLLFYSFIPLLIPSFIYFIHLFPLPFSPPSLRHCPPQRQQKMV